MARGLWVATRARESTPSTANSAPVRSYIAMAHLNRSPAVANDIVSELSAIKRSVMVRNIAWISSLINTPGGMKTEHQLALAKFFFPENEELHLRNGVYKDASQGPPVLFHNRQLWFLLQMAILACRETAADMSEEMTRHAIGRCCLIASDLVGQIEHESLPDLEPVLK
jgi:hypothetical protein